MTALALALLAIALLPASAEAGGLTLGFNSDPVLINPPTAANQFLADEGAAAGAQMVRVNVWWSAVAPARRRSGFAPADPASPGYNWAPVDALVRALSVRNLEPMINVTFAPRWAEGKGRPRSARPGTWNPNPVQFGLFAEAAARRYDGSFPDPLRHGLVLPRVRYWQAWNEPNLGYFLGPQWTSSRRGVVASSPDIYRRMLNDFYAAVKGVDHSNVVVEAGLAPYGNPWGKSIRGIGYRMEPVTFDRLLLSARVYCNVIAQHLYPYAGPLWPASVSGDVAVPDVYKIARLVATAQRARRLLPRGPTPLWVTELGWNSNPPDNEGVSLAQQARWYEQALYELWRQGVNTVLLLQIIDPDSGPWEAGVYFGSGKPKPAATAFRFPFVTTRSGARTVIAWGRAPVAGRLTLERRAGRRWTALATIPVQTNQVFVRTIALRGSAVLRASVGARTSLPWTQPG